MAGHLGVVHLVREINGLEPFERFLASYEAMPAGIEHKLIVLCKGFPQDTLPGTYLERLVSHDPTVLMVEDDGFDIGPYWIAARQLNLDTFCFLNSFSVIRDQGWLAKLVGHLGPSIGAVGATGSWASHSSRAVKNMWTAMFLPPWKEAPLPLPQRRMSLRDRAWLVKRSFETRRIFPPFPNVHLRTNAFVMRRDVMLMVDVGHLSTKDDAWGFESGRTGLTRQLMSRDLDVLVVGRDGHAYPPQEWPQSCTFHAGDQQNLLVSDNQTEKFMALPPDIRTQWGHDTWGASQSRAEPVPGGHLSEPLP